MNIEQQIEESKIKGHKWIDDYASSLNTYIRVINDIPLKFPDYYTIVGHNPDMEINHLKWNKHPNNGWGKPDKDYGSIEIFYLWKQFKPNL